MSRNGFAFTLACAWLMLVAVRPAARAARGETWLRASTPELEVITPLPAKEATAWATEFAQYVAALRTFLNNTRVKLPALTVVVFGRERDFERYYPLLGPGGKPQALEGFFSRHESWAVAGMIARMSDGARRTIFHEGVHWFLSTGNTPNAVWLEEGLAEVFSTFRAEKDRAEWGRAIPEHVGFLQHSAVLPLEKLLYTARGDLFGNDSIRTGIVYAESWAFVHFIIFGKHDLPRNSIADYTAALSSGAHPDEAFKRAFHRSYAEMDRLLERYVGGGSYFVARQPLAAIAAPTVQPATAFEVENALGRLALAGERYALAVTHGRAAIAAAPEDPRGHELLGVALQHSDDAAGARVEFEAAIARDSKNFQPYFEVAVAEHNAAAAKGGELSAADARAIANRYERAINYYPRFRTTYENLAGVIGLAEPRTDEDEKFLQLGLKLFPDSGMIQLGLAQLARRAGDFAGARAQLDKVLASRAGLSVDGMQYAHRLDVAWDQEDIGKEVDRLARDGKFAEALAFLDEKLKQGVDSMVRLRLKPVRDNLEVAHLSQQAKAAFAAGDWVRAREVLKRLASAPAASPMSKDQARRSLADLDRRKLGLETEKP